MKKLIRPVILFISVTTLLSGALQLINPRLVLNILGAETDAVSMQLFATIGMFMFLFGAMMIHALYDEEKNRVVIIWSGLQKIGASAAVFAGIFKGVFIPLAAIIAMFDLLSGLLFFYYIKTLKSHAIS